MPVYVKGTNEQIVGTLERLTGVAAITGLDEAGQPIYAGGTEIFWDDSSTAHDENGEMIFLDANGAEYPRSQIEDREEDLVEEKNRDVYLRPYIVAYRHEAGPTEFFRCQAEDAEHASEQALNAYPDVRITSINPETGDE